VVCILYFDQSIQVEVGVVCVFFGIGDSLPRRVVEGEDRLRQRLGIRNGGYDYRTSF
jgi:hypothetical protein